MTLAALNQETMLYDSAVDALSLVNEAHWLLIEPKRFVNAIQLAAMNTINAGEWGCIAAKVLKVRTVSTNKALRIIELIDSQQTPFSVFVNINTLDYQSLQNTGTVLYLYGKKSVSGYGMQFKSFYVLQAVDKGRIVPVIPGVTGKLYQDDANAALSEFYSSFVTGRRKVDDLLPQWEKLWALPKEQQDRIHSLYDFNDCKSLIIALLERTNPSTYKKALKCTRFLNAADYLYQQAQTNLAKRPTYTGHQLPKEAIEYGLGSAQAVYQLTPCQKTAITTIANDIGSSGHGNALLNGDVGTGKSIVIATVALSMQKAGRQVVIMAPNIGLVDQTKSAIEAITHGAPVLTVTSKNRPPIEGNPIVVGTTAVLSLKGALTPDLLIVDEEQQFGGQQKYALCSENTYHLLASATCVPATIGMASVDYRRVVDLKTRFTERNVSSYLHSSDDIGGLTQAVDDTIQNNNQLLIVLPVADRKTGKYLDSLSVEKVAADWEQAYPGRVVSFTGKLETHLKQDVLSSIQNGESQIVVATSITETGLNLPDLTHVIVLEPARFGARQLHQIRGRAGRYGQQSRFDMVPITPLSDNARKRLSLLIDYDDGYTIAEQELEARGFGSLSYGEIEQHGKPENVIKKRTITPKDIRLVMSRLSAKRTKDSNSEI